MFNVGDQIKIISSPEWAKEYLNKIGIFKGYGEVDKLNGTYCVYLLMDGEDGLITAYENQIVKVNKTNNL